LTRALPPLALYIHIPWCERKCPYCDFNSHALRDTTPDWPAYAAALLDDFAVEYAQAGGRTIHSVFFGGGTPSLLPAPLLKTLLTGLRARAPFARAAEITLEANPGSSEAARFAAFRAAGVNRLSIGIQSFDDGCLARLGRIHDAAQARAAVASARAAGFDNFNLDLMHGLPGQSVNLAMTDLEIACDLQPPHLSWYQLTLEPNTPFHRQPPALPDADTLESIALRGARLLRACGYRQYEVSAWSQPRRRCHHNLNYWRFGDYLGIGAGAHGKLTLADGRILRRWKPRLPRDYLARVGARQPLAAGEQWLTPEDTRFEFLLNALRLKEGVPERLLARAGIETADMRQHLAPLADRGLVRCPGGRIRASARGYAHLNAVLRELLPESIAKNQYSQPA
jgi:oxygen-independent coproporphyrinogen-3 oxidase